MNNGDMRAAIVELHAEIDREASAIAGRLGERITCHRGCAGCCVDGMTVFSVEADRIRSDIGTRLTGEEPHPDGACAFLDSDGACRIYDSRPYVCRTQGLPLRWFDTSEEGETVEYRDICPLNDHGEPVESLPETDCWTIGPAESRLVQLQRGSAERIALRALFLELRTSR